MNSKYWMMHPEMFQPDKNGRVFPPLQLVENPNYNFESDPEYVQVIVPALKPCEHKGNFNVNRHSIKICVDCGIPFALYEK